MHIDVIPAAPDPKIKSESVLKHIDIDVLVATREYTNAISHGFCKTRSEDSAKRVINPAAFLLTPKQFAEFDRAKGQHHMSIPLSRYSPKSAEFCNQVQRFRSSTIPVVHPNHVYIAAVALEVRHIMLTSMVGVATQKDETEITLRDKLRRRRAQAIESAIGDSCIDDQLIPFVENGIAPDTERLPVYVGVDALRDFAHEQCQFEKELAALPDDILSPNAWLMRWFTDLEHVFPDGPTWLTKALLWRDRRCVERAL
jgi:hypothetical protein